MAGQVALRSLLVLAFLLVVSSPLAIHGAITCGGVASAISPCIGYVRGMPGPSAACCSGVKSLTAASTTTTDRQTACSCLKSMAAKITGYSPALAAGLPAKCGVSVPFPISTSTDCTKLSTLYLQFVLLIAGYL